MTKAYIVWAGSSDDMGGDILIMDNIYFSKEKAEARGQQITDEDSKDYYTYSYEIEEVEVQE